MPFGALAFLVIGLQLGSRPRLPAQEPKAMATLEGHQKPVHLVVFNHDGKRLASVSRDRSVVVWDTSTGRATFRSSGVCAAFSPDGKRLALADENKKVKIVDIGTERVVLALEGHTDRINSVAFDPGGRYLASSSGRGGTGNRGEIIVWDLATGKQHRVFKDYAEEASQVTFSPDGKTLAGACYDAAQVWDLTAGKKVLTLEHKGGVHQVAYSPDGKRLAAACGDAVLKVWDVKTRKEERTLRGHTAQVYAVAFGPDGRYLASGGLDRTVRVWDTSTGKAVFVGKHLNWVWSVALSPNGKQLASGSHDLTVKLWDISKLLKKTDR